VGLTALRADVQPIGYTDNRPRLGTVGGRNSLILTLEGAPTVFEEFAVIVRHVFSGEIVMNNFENGRKFKMNTPITMKQQRSQAFAAKLRFALVFLWTLASFIWLFIIAILIFHQPNFPLNLGLVRTTGRTGLWITLLPALWGMLAVCLLFIRRKLGAKLLGIYSAFWMGILLSALPVVWHARHSFCIRNAFCITTPWVGRLTVLAFAVPFLLVALWSYREAIRP